MGIFDFFKKAFSDNAGFDALLKEGMKEKHSYDRYWTIKPDQLKVYNEKVKSLSHEEKIALIVYCLKTSVEYYKKTSVISSSDDQWQVINVGEDFYKQLLEKDMDLTNGDFETVFTAFKTYKRHETSVFSNWPVHLLVNRITKKYKSSTLPETVKKVVKEIQKDIEQDRSGYNEKEKVKLLTKVEDLLFVSDNEGERVKPVRFMGKDEFGDYANSSLETISESEKSLWYKIIALSQKASGSKPSEKFLKESKGLIDELNSDKFRKVVHDWLEFVASLKEKTTEHTSTFNGQTYTHTSTEFLSAPNIDALKGLVWMCSHFHDQKTLSVVADLAERSFRKIPGKGPAAAAIGNACLYSLYKSRGLDGIGHLSRLRLRIRQNTTQNLIEKYLNEAANEQGVSVHEIEDLSVDDYGLKEMRREYDVDGYKAVITIVAIGKTELAWFKPDGSPQKSIPSAVKEKHAAKLKKIKETAKNIEVTLTAQRDRIDRMLKSGRKLSWNHFNEYYFNHGLMSFLTRKIIWTFEEEGKKWDAVFVDGNWTDYKGKLYIPGETVQISLWHPALYSVQEIKLWRQFLLDKELLQPLKQAFREVYLLTDAEVNTRTYSNRMAAHVLKQHQFNSLAKLRGWKNSLLGAYDDGRYNEAASVKLPDYNLRAEFWVNEVNADNAWNDTGIWNYVATDQVRFVNAESEEVVELIHIPSVVFSEVMRDVDLFVGVASVGNDPTWQDSGGVPAYREYWHSYSFGDLSELAKTRKELLEGLIPRLKIARVSEITDKFLVVKGKLRTYKIHIGSTNILMEPNDQYLCIVPDRSQKNHSENLFLPFEGDTGLSIILSKAFLLAEDDKITDTTITSQINRK